MNRKILIVSGFDTESFLDQVITNNIKQIGDGLQYNLLLSPQGKLLHDMFILKVAENQYWLDCYGDAIDDIQAILTKYRLGSKVEFAIKHDIFVRNTNDGYLDPRHPKLPFRSYSSEYCSDAQYDINIYYELCLPRLYIDFDSGKYFPFEVGFNDFNAINYSKGCYIGQEVITRTHHRGVVRKKVYKVMSENELLADSDIYVGQQKIGKLLGIYGVGKALALLNSELITDGLILSDKTKIKIIS
jgi:folate-binding protein YgfZ